MRLLHPLPVLALMAGFALPAAAATLLEENFDTTGFATRGWFDAASTAKISTVQHNNGAASLEMAYAAAGVTPAGLPTPMRHLITATDSVYMRYYVKYSDNWTGSNKSYHPHEFYLLTTADDKWIGPGNTHLTAYIEQNEGKLMLGIQDSLNVDTTKIGVDLTNVTETRATAGCNGNPNAGVTDCYLQSGSYRNENWYKSAAVNFTDTAGASYKGNWHKVETWVKMNTVSGGKGQPDGMMQMWLDDTLIINRTNLILRTAARATTKFNNVLIGPWIGVGSPLAQTTWIDDLLVADALPVQQARPSPPTDLAVQ